MTISIIQEGTSTVTLVNVFTVEPKDQLRLVEHWQQATEEVIRHLPGFISANVHRSLDGTKVINYAQWESEDAFDAMRHNPEAAAHLRALGQIGTPAPVVCEVVSVHHI
ncbi:MAG: antibiotic biosynthesis monooxygenase family protein [Acidimicrobiales bacterium]|jgi:heme-degrading monooxygenase HmoA